MTNPVKERWKEMENQGIISEHFDDRGCPNNTYFYTTVNKFLDSFEGYALVKQQFSVPEEQKGKELIYGDLMVKTLDRIGEALSKIKADTRLATSMCMPLFDYIDEVFMIKLKESEGVKK